VLVKKLKIIHKLAATKHIGNVYRVAENKIPHRTIYNISATSGLILKILEAA